jgi:hypothetical protein
MLDSFPFACQLLAQFTTRLCLAVQHSRNRGRAAHLTAKQDLHLKVAAIVRHSQKVANPNVVRRLGPCPSD